ncbi:hypothetical protein Hypma_003813 [Hypsizygus marmoreus]|uniref:Uncharacterized protein n=1 Tax=Hypsizygus marmoreus TaxID=39966 RepID=A0A369K6T4_HYPMA|nr:hypothetical protein Hypma_003813 [Hypsizygus marmoreus]
MTPRPRAARPPDPAATHLFMESDSLQPSMGSRLASALDLEGEEEIGIGILALLTSAIHDAHPQIPLSRVFHEISQAGAASLLDPLTVLPLLLPRKDPSAKDILALIGECCPAKEVIIAVQEAIEQLEISYDKDEEDENGDDDDTALNDLSRPGQLVTLVEVYSSCIPRLKLRRKTASETISPLLLELESAIQLSGPRATREEGRNLVITISVLVNRVKAWAMATSNVGSDVILACNVALKSVMDCTLVACEHCIESSLTQRSFETFFPRLVVRSALQPGWEGGKEAVSSAIAAYSELLVADSSLLSAPSTSSMIVFAHSELDSIVPDHLSKIIPILIASIQTGSALDEALTIILHGLEPRTRPRPILPEEVIFPLFSVLPPLSCTHPDSLVRHQAYRILSLLLSSCPSQLRLTLLSELVSYPGYPQMCVGAIGLVKEAVLEGIANPPSIFASPLFLAVLGSVIFRASPPDLFANPDLTLEEFKNSSEPARLVECLGLYYILLKRDESNMTQIRDPALLSRIENTWLYPMRMTLSRWAENNGQSSEDDLHDMLPLVSLQMGLERVDAAKSELLDPQWS